MVTDARPVEQPSSRCLRDLGDADPQGVVLESPTGDVTWSALDAESDAIASLLVDRLGAGSHRVAVRTRSYRSMLATQTGVTRAGKVLVPVDPNLPEERALQVLTEAGAALVLTDLEPLSSGVPSVDAAAWLGATERTGVVHPRDPEAPTSLVFTSGSTGVPKGIAQSVAQVESSAGLLADMGSGYRFAAFDVGSVGNYGAMVSAAVLTHSTLVPYDVHALGLANLHVWLQEHGITALGVVPTLLKFWLPGLPEGWVLEPLRAVVSHGESLDWTDAGALRQALPDACRFWNAYGMSETAGISRFEVLPGPTPLTGRVPAGHLLDGMVVRVLDPDGQDVPAGEPGELRVESEAIALGYWQRPDLTADSFTALPDGRRALRTGDAGYLDAEGVLHHLGRLDDVVKVAGHRIDLGDVNAGLRAIPDVSDAVTVVTEEAFGGVRLRSHVLLVEGSAATPLALRHTLSRRLPGYMLPDSIEVRDAFPRLPNEKVDRRALAALQPPHVSEAPLPEDGLLAALQALWRDVLQVPAVGADDDFFDLGGDSLRAALLFAEIQRHLGFDRPPTLLLEAPTPAQLAVALARRDAREVLVPGRATGSLAPLFVVHGGKGDLLFLRDVVAALDPEQPVYGLLAPALDGLAPPERSLEELAARYLVEVRKVWRSGPLHVFGYSLGGLIAFEMAQQARAEGAELGMVAIGDTRGIPRERAQVAVVRARGRVQELRALPRAEAARLAGTLAVNQVKHRTTMLRNRRLDARMDKVIAASAGGVPAPVPLRGEFVYRTYGRLAHHYQPRPLDHEVLLLRTGSAADSWGWERLARSVQVVTIDGDHTSMVREDAASLATALTSALAATRLSATRS